MVFARWFSTVRVLMFRRAAISLLLSALGKQLHDFPLAYAQAPPGFMGSTHRPASQVAEDHIRSGRREERLVVQKGINRRNQVSLRVRLQDDGEK